MGALRVGVAAIALVAAAPAESQSVGDWRPFVTEASQRFGVPIDWIDRVMQAESGGRTSFGGRPIVSRAGAMGLMQLMPRTWNAMRVSLGLGSDPFDPHDNILAGTAYLREMNGRFGYPGLFGAYNAGPARYAVYLGGGAPLPAETTRYLAFVSDAVALRVPTRSVVHSAGGRAATAHPSLFLPLRNAPAAAPIFETTVPDTLFAISDRR